MTFSQNATKPALFFLTHAHIQMWWKTHWNASVISIFTFHYLCRQTTLRGQNKAHTHPAGLTQNPFHDEELGPGELRGLDAKHLPRMIRYGLVWEVLHTLEPVRCIQNQQTQKDGERYGVSDKLHEGTP